MLNTLVDSLTNKLGHFSILKLAICSTDNQMIDLYKTHVEKHNAAILNDPFPNAGFDLFVPDTVGIPNSIESCKMVSMDVKCEMLDQDNRSCAYYMYPRSSLSKTPLILGNHVGIIDSGYRGNLIGAFRNLDKRPFVVEKFTRLLQICNSSLYPIYVIIVDESELSTTSRGSGGFGSSGR
uniref:dUTP diphosphatase n=1 Tax=viral metagenome TaxID=1070528 RepID=A0A6C0I1X8_9ZZZZ